MLAKERASDMYRLSSYFLSRTLSDLPMEWTLPTLFLCIAYFMANLNLSASAFFCTLFGVYLIVTTAQVQTGLRSAWVMVLASCGFCRQLLLRCPHIPRHSPFSLPWALRRAVASSWGRP